VSGGWWAFVFGESAALGLTTLVKDFKYLCSCLCRRYAAQTLLGERPSAALLRRLELWNSRCRERDHLARRGNGLGSRERAVRAAPRLHALVALRVVPRRRRVAMRCEHDAPSAAMWTLRCRLAGCFGVRPWCSCDAMWAVELCMLIYIFSFGLNCSCTTGEGLTLSAVLLFLGRRRVHLRTLFSRRIVVLFEDLPGGAPRRWAKFLRDIENYTVGLACRHLEVEDACIQHKQYSLCVLILEPCSD
jgi:hypothetical protein